MFPNWNKKNIPILWKKIKTQKFNNCPYPIKYWYHLNHQMTVTIILLITHTSFNPANRPVSLTWTPVTIYNFCVSTMLQAIICIQAVMFNQILNFHFQLCMSTHVWYIKNSSFTKGRAWLTNISTQQWAIKCTWSGSIWEKNYAKGIRNSVQYRLINKMSEEKEIKASLLSSPLVWYY
jgi:hypothetical protein